MNILFASSEAFPFSKTGGLADVSASLPTALSRLGHNPYLVIPAYRQSLNCGQPIADTGIEIEVAIGNRVVRGCVLESRLPQSNVPVFLIRQDGYFDRDGLYSYCGEDYPDNCERFVFFSKAVIELIEKLHLNIDILHSNDWQTGLVPAYQHLIYREFPRYEKIVTLHTIHNMAYQGVFWHWDMLLTGIDWQHFTFDKMEYYGKLNLLKTGISFAHGTSTVSPRYAAEIQSSQHGCGLEQVLQFRKNRLRGILNGIDTYVWKPDTDEHLVACYGIDDVFIKKPLCKAALQREMRLPVNPSVPLFAFIGRLAFQKGADLIADVIPTWVENQGAQFCLLGTGEPTLEMRLQDLVRRYPENVAIQLTFSNTLSHRIEAGADIFLMPSRYEPCGLNQMYSQAYGTVPIVHETGGLADTVVNVSDETLANDTATGFAFQCDNIDDMNRAIWRAIDAYQNNRPLWEQLVRNGMKKDWSWDRSAREYIDFYNLLIHETLQQ